MIPPIPQLDPMPLPGPLWLLWGLLLLTFVLHVLPMNLVLGGSLIAAFTRWRARNRDTSHEARLADWFAHAMPILIAATVTLGVAALLFVQVLYGRLFFASSVVMGWFWLGVVPLIIVSYYAAYLLAFARRQSPSWQRLLVWVVWLGVLAVGFTYTNNMTLMLRPAEIAARYQVDARGLQLNLTEPTLVPRFLHVLAGAVALSGLLVAILGVLRRAKEPDFGAWATRYGAKWFLSATIANLLVGFYWLGTLPREVIARFMGGDPGMTGIFVAGIGAGLAAVAFMIWTLATPKPGRAVTATATATVLTIVLMILSRDHVRQAALDAAGFAPARWIAPQWGPIAIFGVLLVGAIVGVTWMVIRLRAGTPQAA